MYRSFTITVFDTETIKAITSDSMLVVYKELTLWMVAVSLPKSFKVTLGSAVSLDGSTLSTYITQEYETVNGEAVLKK